MINGVNRRATDSPAIECALALTWKDRPEQWEVCSVSMNLAAFQMLPVMMLIAGICSSRFCDTGTCTTSGFLIF